VSNSKHHQYRKLICGCQVFRVTIGPVPYIKSTALDTKEFRPLADTHLVGSRESEESGMRMKTILFICIALVAFAPAKARAAVITGTVTVAQRQATPPQRYVTRSGDQQGHATQATPPTLVAIVVEPVDAGTLPSSDVAADAQQVMAQEGTAFVPNLLIVPQGGVVSFPNHDPIFHNVFSYSSIKSFDLGRYPRGESRTVTFNTPGVARIFCEIHASMYASIVVTASPWHSLVPSGSKFTFTDLPAGDYHVLAVDAAGRLSTTDVTLAADASRSLTVVLGN